MNNIKVDKYTKLYEILDYLNNIEDLELRVLELKEISKKFPEIIIFFRLIYDNSFPLTFNVLKKSVPKIRYKYRTSEWPISQLLVKELVNYSDQSKVYRRSQIRVSKFAQALDLFCGKDADLLLNAIVNRILSFKGKRINHILLQLAFPEIFLKNF